MSVLVILKTTNKISVIKEKKKKKEMDNKQGPIIVDPCQLPYFKYSSVYMSIPHLQSSPSPTPSLLVTIKFLL